MRRPRPAAFLGADLHIHTHFSDGQDSPAEVVERAGRCLSLISICDHDTIAAYDDLPEVEGLTVLPGIEITARLGEGSIHILGYFPDGFTASFRSEVTALEEDRRNRVQEGVSQLRRVGIPLRWAHLDATVGPGVPCRSHVARVLVEMRMAHSPQGLYRSHLGGDRFGLPALSAADAIRLIRDEGGTSVWAHPRLEELATHGDVMAEWGLQGVELFRRGGKGGRPTIRAYAERHGLCTTGGSDYHGGTPRFGIGRFRLNLEQVPPHLRPGIEPGDYSRDQPRLPLGTNL